MTTIDLQEKEEVIYPEEFKTYVNQAVGYMKRQVWAGEYGSTIEFGDCEDDGYGTDQATAAVINIDSTYLNFHIRVTRKLLDFWLEGNVEEVAKSLLHEVCHLLTDPICLWAWDNLRPSEEETVRRDIERQNQRITNAIWDLLPENFWTVENVQKLYERESLS